MRVYKTYKCFVNNEFIRSESGRTYKIFDQDGNFLANVPRCTKKDLRDAVRAAKNSLKVWNSKSPYNKGQIIYRIAEETENRKAELIDELKKHNVPNPTGEVQKSIDRLIHYAGWTDKYQHILGSINPVSSSFVNYSVPEYVGVVGCLICSNPPLLSFITQVIPAIVAGNTVVAVIGDNPLPILTFAEILLTSDLTPGVVNILTQYNNEIVEHMAKHMDINLIDYIGSDEQLIEKILDGASINLKRVRIQNLSFEDIFDDDKSEGLYWIEKFVEIKTVWIPQVGG